MSYDSKVRKLTVAVLGAGNMGTALAQVIAKNGHRVKLWNHGGDPEPLRQIISSGENKKYLPGVKLSKNIFPEAKLSQALERSDVVFFVVPSAFAATLIKRAAPALKSKTVCVDASKGLDEKSLWLVPTIMKKYLPHQLVASISGPAIANDLARGGFTAMDVASTSPRAIKLTRAALENDHLRLTPTTDMIGVEISGSLKNVYAIALGFCDGLKMPMNTKAALLIAALQEIGTLVRKMGGQEKTIYGLAGLGDLVGTGLCSASRNRRFGELLANGHDRDEAMAEIKQMVEGIQASKVLTALGKKYKLRLPFANMVYRAVWKRTSPAEELKKFLQQFN